MLPFKFSHPIIVRYGDLDPQGHVNNATYLTYFEHGRIHYLLHLGLFSPEQSFLQIGIIVASAQIVYRQPIHFGQDVRVAVAITRLGNKSLDMIYRLYQADNDQTLAEGNTALVTFDYPSGQTIPIPPHWRETIQRFEGLHPPDERSTP